jgi:hypothetical protein
MEFYASRTKRIILKMNNEPVAWINKEDGNLFVDWDKNPYAQEHFPLYTHPAKTLTDEEIQQIWLEFDARNTNDWFIAIARAILKKASEK